VGNETTLSEYNRATVTRGFDDFTGWDPIGLGIARLINHKTMEVYGTVKDKAWTLNGKWEASRNNPHKVQMFDNQGDAKAWVEAGVVQPEVQYNG
jgi:hypothetical protein